jgi:hypothetical protein
MIFVRAPNHVLNSPSAAGFLPFETSLRKAILRFLKNEILMVETNGPRRDKEHEILEPIQKVRIQEQRVRLVKRRSICGSLRDG